MTRMTIMLLLLLWQPSKLETVTIGCWLDGCPTDDSSRTTAPSQKDNGRIHFM